MADYKTPGVYVLEKNSFGSSIVANATAVPMFIGFTEKAVDKKGADLSFIKGSTTVREPIMIKSALEYELYFGGADTAGIMTVTGKVTEVKDETGAVIETLIGAPYSAEIQNADGTEYVPGLMDPSVSNYFANGGGSCYILSIGDYASFDATADPTENMDAYTSAIKLAEECTIILPTDLVRYKAEKYYNVGSQLANTATKGDKKKYFTILDVVPADSKDSVYDVADAANYRTGMTSLSTSYVGAYFPYLKSLTAYAYDATTLTLNTAAIPADNNALKEEVKAFLAGNYINMPPSPFMAGIYSKLDNATGVWTPPANVAPASISGPVVKITNSDQEGLNVDGSTGKSINAIRSFTGKGTLVWGARTNDGNSLDWRYINVRRLFMSMENDISQALDAYVFKANVHNTWVEVKTMIESYLYGLYNSGAFAGTTPETSYQVSIGLGSTMTDEDVLNGYMRASIMVAPVRPAEFIVLTFSQMVGQ
ncbi:MAG: phage tail sheath protein FI [Crocinitomicaceae bacterium]|jgi:phage tail sheath protein FI